MFGVANGLEADINNVAEKERLLGFSGILKRGMYPMGQRLIPWPGPAPVFWWPRSSVAL